MPPLFALDSMTSLLFQGGTFGRSPENITVSLTSTNSTDQRIVQLQPGVPFSIGRASRSAYRNLPESEDNALFDCPVVSRTHAELRLSPWTKDQVTIVDKSSLHGTSVNGYRLYGHTPFTLKPGDIIKLGDRVAKGDNAHDGIALTFDILHNTTPKMCSSQTAFNSRGFHVPDDSDRSDFGSDLESIKSRSNERSSAKTTPEQPKAGSQQQPIDLDQVVLPVQSIGSDDNNDSDDENEDLINAAQVTDFRIIPESIDQATFLIAGSVHDSPKTAAFEGEGEDHQIASQYNMGAWELDDDYNPAEMRTTAQTQTPGEGQSLPNDSIEEDQGSLIIDRAASDAFRSAGSQPPAQMWDGAAPEPRRQPYDPVRASARQGDRPLEAAQSQQKFHIYTYGPRNHVTYLLEPHTDQHASSRWDVPPALPQTAAMPANPLNLGSTNAWQTNGPSIFDMYSTAPTEQQSSSDVHSSDLDVQTDAAVVDGPSGHGVSKGKMPINAMPRTEEPPVSGAVAASSANPEVSIASPPIETNKKRKATNVEEIEVEETAPPAKRVAMVAPGSDLARPIAPSRTSIVAKEAGKFVVSAISGAVAFGFFLHSSYAERLMDYLD